MPTQPSAAGSRALRPAVLCDLIALAGLVAVAIGASVRGGALVLVFFGALAGIAAIPGVVLSAIALRRSALRRGWPTGRFAVTVAGLGVAAVLVGPVVAAVAWNSTPNPATTAAAPLEVRIRAAGGRLLCTNGDPGRGPDNFSPWHEAYYSVPNSAGTLQRLRGEVGSAGFEDLRRVPNRASSFSDSRRFSARPAVASTHRAGLSVEVSPTGTQLDCEPDYGRTVHPAKDALILDLTTVIDPTR